MTLSQLSLIPRQRVILARVRDPRFRGKPAEVMRYLKTRNIVVTRLDDGTRYDTPPDNLDPVDAASRVTPANDAGSDYSTPRHLLQQLREPGAAVLRVETSSGEAEVSIEKRSLVKWLSDCAPNLECGFRGTRAASGNLVIRLA
jgi:hypothetical protein